MSNKRIIILLTFISVVSFVSGSYGQKLKTLVKKGDQAFAGNDYFGASIYYNKAILKDSSDMALQYKYAEASRLNYDFSIAERWYEKVYKQDRQGKEFPECIFWLATIAKGKGDYKQAIDLFNKYVRKNKKNNDNYLFKKAEQEITSCKYAQWLTDNPDTTITIIHLDSTINSTVSEYAPFQKDSVLYFSSLRNANNTGIDKHLGYSKIYTSVLSESIWEKPLELDTIFNSPAMHTANTSFNRELTTMYFSKCIKKDGLEFNCEIYSSIYKQNNWSTPEKLPSEINLPGSNNTQPAIGYLKDREVLFFASNRPGGEGGMDIWYSKIKADGSFEKPINAGKKVNSIEDEKTPFYCNPCQELFFSSTWHKGLGGFDIFKSNYDDKGFSEPQNLGLPINSPYNDVYFSINSPKNKAFFSSNRTGSFFEEKESCCNDLYMFKIPGTEENDTAIVEDSLQLAQTQLKLLVPLTLYFHNDEPDSRTLATTTKKTYREAYEQYYGLKDLYKNKFVQGAKPKDTERADAAIEELFEDSVTSGMNKLDEFAGTLIKLLENGETVTITMRGYSSPLASTSYNANLCKRRIYSVKNYFREYRNGILLPYIDNKNFAGGHIYFIEEEFGELKANTNVSDDYLDSKNSVFSPLAAYERKIQIIAVSFPTEKE